MIDAEEQMSEAAPMKVDGSAESAVERAYRVLREQILTGELAVGSMLGKATRR